MASSAPNKEMEDYNLDEIFTEDTESEANDTLSRSTQNLQQCAKSLQNNNNNRRDGSISIPMSPMSDDNDKDINRIKDLVNKWERSSGNDSMQALEPIIESMKTSNIKISDNEHLKKLFFLAIKKKKLDEISLLLDHVGKINFTIDKHQETCLHLVCREGHFNIASKILEQPDININAQNQKKETPLYLAAKDGHVEIVELLIKEQADPFLPDKRGKLPLHIAAYYGKQRCCELLTKDESKKNRQLSRKNNLGDTPLLVAANNGYKNCCKFLINDDVINEPNSDGNTPLICAAKRGFHVTAQYLLDNGANHIVKNTKNCSPIFLSAFLQAKETFEVLFPLYEQLDPNPLELNYLNMTIVHAAARNSIECLNLLITKEIPLDLFNKQDSEGNTPLHSAIINRNIQCAELLIKHRVALDILNNENNSVLHLAVEKKIENISSLILSRDRSNINTPNYSHLPPLLIAVKSKSYDCCKILLRRWARKTAIDENGKNAFQISVEEGDLKLCKLLIHEGISTDTEDFNKNTPLHTAAARGNLECCEYLINHVKTAKNSLKLKNSNNKLPLELAFENEHDDVFSLLLMAMSEKDIDKKKIHLYMHAALNRENRRILVEGIIESKLWKCGFRMYPTEHEECYAISDSSKLWYNDTDPILQQDFSILYDVPCSNFNSLIKLYPDLAKRVMDKCITNTPQSTIYDCEILDNSFYQMENKATNESVANTTGVPPNKIIKIGNCFQEETYKLKENVKAIKCDNDWRNNHVVSTMVSEKKLDLLKHNLLNSWFNDKWTSYIGFFVMIQLLLRLFNTVLVSTLMAYMWSWKIVLSNTNSNITEEEVFEILQSPSSCFNKTKDNNFCDNTINKLSDNQKLVNTFIVLTWIMLITILFSEAFKFYKLRQFYSHFNGVKLARMIRMACLCLAIIPTNSIDFYSGIRQDWQWQTGVIAVMFFWLQVINALNKIPIMSVFLPITVKFLLKFFRIIFFIFTIIIAFAFVFHLTLNQLTAFATLPESIIKTTVWLMGDLAYDDTFVSDKLYYPWLSKVIFIFFTTTVAGFIASLLISNPYSFLEEYLRIAELHKYELCTDLFLTFDTCFPYFRKKTVKSRIEVPRNLNTTWENFKQNLILFQEIKPKPDEQKDLKNEINKIKDEINNIKESLEFLIKNTTETKSTSDENENLKV